MVIPKCHWFHCIHVFNLSFENVLHFYSKFYIYVLITNVVSKIPERQYNCIRKSNNINTTEKERIVIIIGKCKIVKKQKIKQNHD